jgi:hypothetical protein
MEYPRLVESNVRAYLYNTLNKCHEYKASIYSWTFNISIFLGLVLIIGIILYLRRKRELPVWEKEARMLQEQNYVLSKIREYQMDQKRQSSMITDLPFTYNPDVNLVV